LHRARGREGSRQGSTRPMQAAFGRPDRSRGRPPAGVPGCPAVRTASGSPAAEEIHESLSGVGGAGLAGVAPEAIVRFELLAEVLVARIARLFGGRGGAQPGGYVIETALVAGVQVASATLAHGPEGAGCASVLPAASRADQASSSPGSGKMSLTVKTPSLPGSSISSPLLLPSRAAPSGAR